MYFTNDSSLPENQNSPIVTSAPFGSELMPSYYPEDIVVSQDAQCQTAVDRYNSGATLLYKRVRDPKTGHVSKNFKEYADFIRCFRQGVPKTALPIGGSISFAPKPEKAAYCRVVTSGPCGRERSKAGLDHDCHRLVR
jgi:uncharacterized protein (DUF849 family)